MAMIEIKNLSKWYGNFQVLKNCNVSIYTCLNCIEIEFININTHFTSKFIFYC